MALNPKEQDFITWYDTYNDAIFRHCYFRVNGDRERAKELVQDVFLKTWRYYQTHEIENVRAFLYRVATNLVIDEAKQRKYNASLETLRQEQGFEPKEKKPIDFAKNWDIERILVLIEQLPSEYRDVIVMRYIDELNPKEIAEILEENANTVSVRINRAVAKVRELLSYEEQL